MQVFRTPESRFEAWTDFPYKPNYLQFEGIRMHYVDEGPKDAPVMLLVHGMPTNCWLYRHLIPVFLEAGYRCVVPDHIGFGRSDKVLDDAWYSVDKHQMALQHLVETLDLQRITVMVQDWGGPLGLRGPVDMPDRYERLCILNTWLHHRDFPYGPMMWGWNRVWRSVDIPGKRNLEPTLSMRMRSWVFATFVKLFQGKEPVAAMIYTASYNKLGINQKNTPLYRAYDAPFPNYESRAGARRFPLSLPMYNPEGGNAAVQERCHEAIKKWEKPAHFLFGDGDPNFTIETMEAWAAGMPNATTYTIKGAAHFPQESHPKEVAEVLLKRIAAE
jgi:haloalkane dehalogenase